MKYDAPTPCRCGHTSFYHRFTDVELHGASVRELIDESVYGRRPPAPWAECSRCACPTFRRVVLPYRVSARRVIA